MGGGGVKGGRAPSHVAYYVALAGVLSLLLLLCCYFLYFFVKKVLELSSAMSPTPSSTGAPPRTVAPAYAVRPEVRVSAHAMAQLCEQLPPSAPPSTGAGAAATRGDTVYPSAPSVPLAPPKVPIITNTGPPPPYIDAR